MFLWLLSSKAFQNIVWNWENAGNQHFPTMSSILVRTWTRLNLNFWTEHVFSVGEVLNLTFEKRVNKHAVWCPLVLITMNRNIVVLGMVNPFPNKPWLENTVGKGEIARYEQFLLFPQCFLLVWITFRHFHFRWSNLKLPSINSFILEESKLCRLGEVLSVCVQIAFGRLVFTTWNRQVLKTLPW